MTSSRHIGKCLCNARSSLPTSSVKKRTRKLETTARSRQNMKESPRSCAFDQHWCLSSCWLCDDAAIAAGVPSFGQHGSCQLLEGDLATSLFYYSINMQHYSSRRAHSVYAVTETLLKSISTKFIPHRKVSYFTSCSIFLTLSLCFLSTRNQKLFETLDSSPNTQITTVATLTNGPSDSWV